MSSSSSSSSGTGAKSPGRLPRRSSRILRRAAAAIAVAAAVWAPLSMAFAGGAGVAVTPWAATLGVGVYFALGPDRRLRLRTYVIGVVLAYAAVYAGFILFLFTGCQSDNGLVDGWMWAVGLIVIGGGSAWALRRPRRTVWGLPAATFAGFVVMSVLALVFNGSTGWCPD